jgi:hypothetical protein
MIIPAITLSGFLLSCNIINPPEEIPSYIKIDTFLVKVTNFDEGSASHNITCVKVIVGDGATNLGFFEMPTMIPSLSTGEQSLFIYPVIELNGIAGSREVYPFFNPYTGTGKFDLVPGEVVTINPITTYKEECKFPWIEDFEDAGVSFEYSAESDTVFRTESDTVKEGRFSGAIYLDKDHAKFEAYSSTAFELPEDGSPILLEFDYRGTATIEVGLFAIQDQSAGWNSMVYVRPVAHWNRIYIDINSTVVYNKDNADLYRPGLRIVWDSTGPAQQSVLMDNIKLIHF